MTKSLEQAKLEHAKFLQRMGCTKDQLKSRKKSKGKCKLGFTGTAKVYFEEKSLNTVMQGDKDTATKRDVMSNIYKESPEVQAQIREKAARVGIAYNKGGYQLITPGMDPKNLGRK
jgi:hypothetical protein